MLKTIPLKHLIRLMRLHSVEIQQQICSCPIQMSIPTDGKGVRIRVSVPRGYSSKIPDQITFTLEGQIYVIPLEVDTDYQNFALLAPRSTIPTASR